MLYSTPVYAEENTVEEISIVAEGETTVETLMETFLEETEVEESDPIVESFESVEETVVEVIEETGEVNEAYKKTGVEGYVYRLYKVVLNREPDPVGYKDWVSQLKNKQITGAKAAEGFVLSNEFQKRKLSNSERVEILYQTFLDRASDAAGKKDWVNKLDKGMSLTYVYHGFANSVEFKKVCKSYGIDVGGVILTEPRDLNEGITMFVYRCYQKFLGRTADIAGLNDWCNRLITGKINAKEAAYGFVMSKEFQSKKMSNTEYVKTLYLGLFGREADTIGLKDWVNKLNGYYSRAVVFYGFADSQEFRKLVESYGLSSYWDMTLSMFVDGGVVSLNNFIQSGAYKKAGAYKPECSGMYQYVIFDINSDGMLELLIQQQESKYSPFYYTWLFVLEYGSPLCIFESYGYGQYEYSSKHNAMIVSSDVRPNYYYGSVPFYCLNGLQFKQEFILSNDGDIFYYSDKTGKKRISESRYKSYFENKIFLDWIDL